MIRVAKNAMKAKAQPHHPHEEELQRRVMTVARHSSTTVEAVV